MKAPCIVVFATAAMIPGIVSSQEAVDGSEAAIRSVVSGKTCIGRDVLSFGESAPGSAGIFKRAGRLAGTYSIGYGTILIRRRQYMHGHVAAVTLRERVLYLNGDRYRCGKNVSDSGQHAMLVMG